MQRTLLMLGIAVALAGGNALAQQQQQQQTGGGSSSSGPSLTEKAKDAAHAIGEKAKEATEKMKDKAQAASDRARDDSGTSQASAGDRMQKEADARFKAAKARCEPLQQKAQKTLCEKEAAAAHAKAEVDVARANLRASGSDTSAMGAGKQKR